MKASCPFCDITEAKGFSIVHEGSELIAIRDRSPQAETHLLIIPREHVGVSTHTFNNLSDSSPNCSASTVRDLTAAHIPLIVRMVSLGKDLVPSAHKMGFHIPPFSSVHHLHLHVLGGKPAPLARFKYPIRASGGGKGLSWFVTADQAVAILRSGSRIGLGTHSGSHT